MADSSHLGAFVEGHIDFVVSHIDKVIDVVRATSSGDR
jgi:hypothetical protein